MELLTIAETVRKAKCPEDVFGAATDTKGITAVYRQLVVVIHPDHFLNDAKHLPVATQSFERLTSLRSEAERKLKVGTYGKRDIAAPPAKQPFAPMIIEARGKKFILTEPLAHGDLCDLFVCTYTNGSKTEHRGVFKVARHGSDNDLIENEAKILTTLYPPKTKDEGYYRLLSKVYETFIIREPGSQRRANILPLFDEYRGIDEVMRVFPDGIDFRDMVWMFKRLLLALGFAHSKNVIHGAVLPPHVLVHPVNHGARLIDWSYAVDITPPKKPDPKPSSYRATLYDHLDDDDFLRSAVTIKAISAAYRDYYPPEILKKQTPTPAADIYMAAKCAVAVVGGDLKKNTMPDDMPKTVQAFFTSCLHKDPEKRPQNAWDAHDNFNDILKAAVGKRKYRPFPMPDHRS
jgi:serine/threonine protein kinase